MDNTKTGRLICRLRKEHNMTQRQLADIMNISDKTVSKWERGLGSPDLSLLPELSKIFNVDIERLLDGEMAANKMISGNMRKMCFYVCPDCGNIITALADTVISCCGKKLKALQPHKVEDSEKLDVEIIENEYYVTTSHPMERHHYISFIAIVNSDSVHMKKLYPQWDVQARLPFFARGRLIWYCTEHGLFYQEVKK